MRLRQHLSVPAQASELLIEAGEVLSRASALKRLEGSALEVCRYGGQSVALVPPSTGDLLLWLIALDGVAGSILILSEDTPAEQIQSFSSKAGCQVVIDGPFPSLGGSSGMPSESMRSSASGLQGQAVDTTWIIPTSGTTSTPKLVSHDLASLTRSLKTDSSVGSRLRWGLLYDPTRFAGLQTLLQGLCGGSTLIQPRSLVDPAVIVEGLSQCRCNALSATPSMWRRLLMAEAFDDLQLDRA